VGFDTPTGREALCQAWKDASLRQHIQAMHDRACMSRIDEHVSRQTPENIVSKRRPVFEARRFWLRNWP
jgi:hypothetical protein